MEQTAARISHTSIPTSRSKKDVSVNAFVEEQARKKAEIDQLMEEQQRRLRELSSPLPITNKSSKKIVSSSPLSTKPVPKMSTSAKTKVSASNPSVGLVPQVGKPLSNSYNAVNPPKPTVTGPTLAQLTMKKDVENKSTPPSIDKATVPPSPTVSSSSPRLSLSALTTLKRDDDSKVNTNNISSDKKMSPPVTRERTGPIRQQILSTKESSKDTVNDEDEDDEFFSYSRTGPNNGVSIQDIMKRKQQQEGTNNTSGDMRKNDEKSRAKKWGIDIDKFT